MNFLWPEMLLLQAIVPILVIAYLWLLRRRKKTAMRYASLSIVRDAMGVGHQLRRHIPPLLFLIALATMLLAIARPTAVVLLPSQHETIILAMDVSGSMRANDVEPNRLAAAQGAAKAFITDLPRHTRVGIVSFAGTAAVVQPPTRNREDLTAAIDRFQLQRGTAIGSGIIVSLATLFPDAGFDVGAMTYGRPNERSAPLSQLRDNDKKKDFKPVPPGSHASAAIILLTDGQRTTGPDSIEAAKLAADRGVRIFTVGVGTVDGTTIGFEGWSFRVRLDEETLKAIAMITRGEYFFAGTATDLKKIYQSLNSRLVFEKKETEITALFTGAAALLALLAALLSLLWFNRVL